MGSSFFIVLYYFLGLCLSANVCLSFVCTQAVIYAAGRTYIKTSAFGALVYRASLATVRLYRLYPVRTGFWCFGNDKSKPEKWTLEANQCHAYKARPEQYWTRCDVGDVGDVTSPPLTLWVPGGFKKSSVVSGSSTWKMFDSLTESPGIKNYPRVLLSFVS